MFLSRRMSVVVVSVTLGALGTVIGLAAQNVLAEQQTDAGAATGKEENPRTKALRTSLAELKKTYGLADDEMVKCVQPPFSQARQDCFQAYANWDGKQDWTGFMIFGWNKGDLKVHAGHIGSPGSGFDLPGLLTASPGIYPQEIEGEKELLENPITADFIFREGAPVKPTLTRLENILQKECKLSVKLSLEEVPRTVFVVRGKYKFTPAAGSDGKQVEIYAKELTGPNGSGGGSGDFPQLINWIGRFVNRRIVIDKVENAPRTVSWHDNFRSPFTEEEHEEDHDPGAVLKNITAQTSLTFQEEIKRVRVLQIERMK
jgi:hypothetical protein